MPLKDLPITFRSNDTNLKYISHLKAQGKTTMIKFETNGLVEYQENISYLIRKYLLQVNAVNRGSCEGCEAKCGMVFKPVCTKDQKLVYPNICQAKCAGVEDTVDCQVG